MGALHAQLQGMIREVGYSLPDGPVLPPMDLVDGELSKLGMHLSRVAVALGREADVRIITNRWCRRRGR